MVLLEDCQGPKFMRPADQYDAKTKKLKHEPDSCHLVRTIPAASDDISMLEHTDAKTKKLKHEPGSCHLVPTLPTAFAFCKGLSSAALDSAFNCNPRVLLQRFGVWGTAESYTITSKQCQFVYSRDQLDRNGRCKLNREKQQKSSPIPIDELCKRG